MPSLPVARAALIRCAPVHALLLAILPRGSDDVLMELTLQAHEVLLLRHHRRLSTRCILDEDGLVGHCHYHDRLGVLLVARRRWGGCRTYFNLWRYATDGPTGWSVQKWGDHVAEFVRKVKASEGVGRQLVVLDDEKFKKRYPAIFEHLTLDTLEGSPRETSTLGVSTELGRWKACLRDRDNGLCLWVSGDTFDGLLGALEGILAKGGGDWREDKYASSKRPAGKRS